jgi:hypothetical protein
LKNFAAAEEATLWAIQQTIISKKFVDRTHEFAPGIPRWPGFPDEARTWDPPAHFIKGSQQGVNLRSIGILPLAMVKKLLG